MNRTRMELVVLALVGLSLVACGRREVSPTAPTQAVDNKPKDDAKTASPPDDAPKVADPLKEGY